MTQEWGSRPDALQENEDMTQLLKGLSKSEDELDVPSFLRRPLFSHRRQAVTPASKVVNTPQSTNPV